MKKAEEKIVEIPLDLIDEPRMLRRETMGDIEMIKELGRSMRKIGQLEPIIVAKLGERYDLVIGSRRVHAAKLIGMVSVKAIIIDADDAKKALMRYQENVHRLQNSPYEEGLYLVEMLDNLQCTQTELAEMINKSASYVSQRIGIMKGYPSVKESLRSGKINFNQTRELMLMPDEKTAEYYLQIVERGGATADLIRGWRNDLVAAYKRIESEDDSIIDEETQRTIVRMNLLTCECCRTVIDPRDIRYLKVCHLCQSAIVQAIGGDKK